MALWDRRKRQKQGIDRLSFDAMFLPASIIVDLNP